jgi:integrase
MGRHATQIYWRKWGRVRHAWADLRAYADLGGKREPLVAPGEKVATADPATAQVLLARRIEQLDALRRGRALHGLVGEATLDACARDYLVAKAAEVNAKTGEPITEQWMEGKELRLNRALEHFGKDRDLGMIDVDAARAYDAWLKELGLAGGMRRHHLNTLSALYRYAGERKLVAPGYNPIALWRKKPTARRVEARWLEVHDAALLLEAARTYRPAAPKGGRLSLPCIYELIATFLLTGGRESEVLGLEVDDVSLARSTVTFRPNRWRRLKTATSHRTVPLWPQLAEVLRDYFPRREREPGTLLFPSFRTGREAVVSDFRKALDAVAGRVGWKAGEIRSKMFRHTYCAARLQTLDQGAPVSVFTVGREMGHGGEAMVRKVYGHLGQVRHRAADVEYRVEQHAAKLEERLDALARSMTRNG